MPSRPRARLTCSCPRGDCHTHTKDFLEAQIPIPMGGRVAEELFTYGSHQRRVLTTSSARPRSRGRWSASWACRRSVRSPSAPAGPCDYDRAAGVQRGDRTPGGRGNRRLVMRGYETARQLLARAPPAVRAPWPRSCWRSSRSTPRPTARDRRVGAAPPDCRRDGLQLAGAVALARLVIYGAELCSGLAFGCDPDSARSSSPFSVPALVGRKRHMPRPDLIPWSVFAGGQPVRGFEHDERYDERRTACEAWRSSTADGTRR